MAAGLQEAQQLVRCDRRGRLVVQRVRVNRRVVEDSAGQHHGDRAGAIVHHRKRGHRARLHAQALGQQLGAAEGEIAAGADHMAQRLQIDLGVFRHGDQPLVALLVAQEQVLDMRARQGAAQRLRFGHRVQRRVAVKGDRYAQFGQPRQQRRLDGIGVVHDARSIACQGYKNKAPWLGLHSAWRCAYFAPFPARE